MMRQAKLSDLDKIINWIPDEQACKFWAGPLVRFPFNITMLAEDIGFDKNRSYSLWENDELIAFGQLIEKKNGFLHLARIIVNPAYRGQKFGEKLCRLMISTCREQGFSDFSLNVYRNNFYALDIYKKLDFQVIEEQSSVENCYMVAHYDG